jgi:hypothetical protein
VVGGALATGCTGDNPDFADSDTTGSTGNDTTSSTTRTTQSSTSDSESGSGQSDTQTPSTTTGESDSEVTLSTTDGATGATSGEGGSTGGEIVYPDLVVFMTGTVQGNFAELSGDAFTEGMNLCAESASNAVCNVDVDPLPVIRVGGNLTVADYPAQWADSAVFGSDGDQFVEKLSILLEQHLAPAASLFDVSAAESMDTFFWSGGYTTDATNCADWMDYNTEGTVGSGGVLMGWFTNTQHACSQTRPLLCLCERA